MKKITLAFFAVLISGLTFADTLNVPVTNVPGLQGSLLVSGTTQYRYTTDNSGSSYIETYNQSTQTWDKSIKLPAYLSSYMVFWGLAKDKNGLLDQNKSILLIQCPEYIYVLGIDFIKKSTTQLAALHYSLYEADQTTTDGSSGIQEPTASMENGCLIVSMNNIAPGHGGWSVDIEPFLTDSMKSNDSPKDTIAKIPDSEV